MFFSSWLRTRTRPGASEARRTSRPTRRQATFRPRLEVLEGRDVPSTLTVTTNLDTGLRGDGSLRGEIAAAQSGDTIVFDPSLAGTQILLRGSQLYVNTNLTIQGLPTGSVISGSGSSRVFDVTPGVSVALTNLTITHGIGIQDSSNAVEDATAGEGAGILNGGTLTLRNCTVTGNTGGLSVFEFGSGIYNALGATLTVTGSTVSGNAANSKGGGIYNAGSLTVDGSVLTGNSAFDGGGIFNAAGGTLSVTGSTLSANIADFEGGGLYNSDRASASIMNCTVTGNTASYGGGGIYNNKYGHLAVGSTAFSANTPDDIFGSYANKKGNTFG